MIASRITKVEISWNRFYSVHGPICERVRTEDERKICKAGYEANGDEVQPGGLVHLLIVFISPGRFVHASAGGTGRQPGVRRRERFEPAADARRRRQQPVCRQLWTTGRWYPSAGVRYLGSNSGGASLRYGLRSQYPRLSERGDLLPRLRRIQLPPPDHHHLPGHRGHAPRALHQDRCGRDHPLRHHLPEPPLAQQLAPRSQGEQRGTHLHRGRDADQPHQRQGTARARHGAARHGAFRPSIHGVLAQAPQHHWVVSGNRTCGGLFVCLLVCYQGRPEPAGTRRIVSRQLIRFPPSFMFFLAPSQQRLSACSREDNSMLCNV
ncbi:hypothetical protein Q8A73_019473 [Channa argus]|nr:hypothetical protein Q8A73_019473 [Channa argus]